TMDTGISEPKMPLGSLLLSESVAGAPGADNLKIRPEFFPVGVGNFNYQLVFGQKCASFFADLANNQ
ncbi:hypothetical protein, partial [Photobacterium halotolerans]|uniref:hypothetical protein n=1 Tax=Photobacterium halotolerans TaxID=265726 RepID=UPI001F2AD3E9